jgi:ribosome-binding factor A
MPRDFPRSRRIEEQIQRILSDIIRVRVRDPRLRQVIITDVKVSRDLSVAWVYYGSLERDPQQAELAHALEAAQGFLRSQLGGELTVRQVPELRFRFDDSAERAMALEQLIDKAVAKDRASRNEPEDVQN